ncbi:hypothetical protein LWI29_006419 [Acer saccharum]|uniref:Uncharacterized protein n=1 Tax=Acer saccharum TaxID=4024 RepID=A0AA39S7N9_ACESA|nr:hypothetical protein LWI29_006419 [Acer saccharum]
MELREDRMAEDQNAIMRKKNNGWNPATNYKLNLVCDEWLPRVGAARGKYANFFNLVLEYFSLVSGDGLELFCVIVWRVWFLQNSALYGFSSQYMADVVSWARDYLTGYQGCGLGKMVSPTDIRPAKEEMQKLEGELTHDETPPTDVEIIERVLGPRSAYIKGFRKVHKTLMSSIPSSSTQEVEMIALKTELESTQEELRIAKEKSLNTEERVKRLEELCLGNKDSLIMHLLS